MNGIKWLTCFASSGQFNDEYAVHGADYEKNEFSLFAPRDYVRVVRSPAAKEEVPAHLQVAVLEQKGNLFLVKLPKQTFDNGWTITVREDQLEDCESRQYA